MSLPKRFNTDADADAKSLQLHQEYKRLESERDAAYNPTQLESKMKSNRDDLEKLLQKSFPSIEAMEARLTDLDDKYDDLVRQRAGATATGDIESSVGANRSEHWLLRRLVAVAKNEARQAKERQCADDAYAFDQDKAYHAMQIAGFRERCHQFESQGRLYAHWFGKKRAAWPVAPLPAPVVGDADLLARWAADLRRRGIIKDNDLPEWLKAVLV